MLVLILLTVLDCYCGFQDISQIKQSTLRRAIGVVPQDTVLFHNDVGGQLLVCFLLSSVLAVYRGWPHL